MFQRDQKGFFRTPEGEEGHEGNARNGKVCQVLGRYLGERKRKKPIYAMDKEIRRQLNEKVSQVNEFNITFEKVKKEIAKRKGWTASGIDGIQNYWWKKLEPAQKTFYKNNKGIYKNQER